MISSSHRPLPESTHHSYDTHIQTQNPCKREAAEPRLRPRGYGDQRIYTLFFSYALMSFVRKTLLSITINFLNLRVILYKSWLGGKPFRLSYEKYFLQTLQNLSVLVQRTWVSTRSLEVHGTDRCPSGCCLRSDTGSLKHADRRICLTQTYGRLRPPSKTYRSLQQHKNA